MYYFYIDNILMPVPPEKLSVKIKNRNTTVDLISGGEINIPRTPGLTEISFELLLPVCEYPFALYENGFKSPDYFIGLFEKLKVQRQPFNFIVIRTISAETLLKASAKLISLPGDVSRWDFNGDGTITAADARILLKNQNGITLLNDTNMKCLIEDYTITEDAGKYGRDYSVSMSLKQYVDYGVKTVTYKTQL